MSRRNRLLLLALLCLIIAPLTAGFGPPHQADSPLTIQLDAGYGLRFRGDQWLPLRLTLSNDGPDVRGALRVRSESNPGLSATTYSTSIDLPNQSRKQVFLYISIQGFARQVTVELVDDSGTILGTQENYGCCPPIRRTS